MLIHPLADRQQKAAAKAGHVPRTFTRRRSLGKPTKASLEISDHPRVAWGEPIGVLERRHNFKGPLIVRTGRRAILLSELGLPNV